MAYFGRNALGKMKKKIILPIHKPIINHIPADSFLLSVIGDTEAEMDWIMGNFINIRMNPKIGYNDFFRTDMWYNCYFIYENRMTRDFIINNTSNIPQFFMNQISNGFYAYTYLNRACISNYVSKRNTTHNPLLYGYDQEKGIFYVADFFADGKLSFETCSFEEVEKAFDIEGLDYKYILYRFFKKVDAVDFKFDYKNTILQLENYIESKNMYMDGLYHYFTNESEDAIAENVEHGFDFVFGLAFYDGLKQMYMKNWDAVKAAHVLVLHKELMAKRIEYFFGKGLVQNVEILRDKCSELIRMSTLLRNVILKRTCSNNQDSDEEIIRKIDKIHKEDYVFSKILLNEMREGVSKRS